MSFLQRFVAWWGLEDTSPTPSELRLMKAFADDVSAFFEKIGMQEQVAIRKLPSGVRQQNLAVELFDVQWRFQQESTFQSLAWRSARYPEIEIAADFMPYYFAPPSEAEINDLARSPNHWSRFETLDQLATYVSNNLKPIVLALAGDDILQVAQQQQDFDIRFSNARREAWSGSNGAPRLETK